MSRQVEQQRFRQPIITVLGHVDSGKTTLLDKIRGTAVQVREAGGITQHIGASLFPKETVEGVCGDLLDKFNFEMDVPGILVIDTPGHEVFSNLRVRGGSASDIAILVVDVTRGFQPQTHESLQILEARDVPFLVAVNKVDAIHGWKSPDTLSISESLETQRDEVKQRLQQSLYDVTAALSTYDYEAERFDRVKDFKETVAMVPTSAKTGEGIRELLTLLVGLVQRFLLDRLEVSLTPPARGTVLEVSEEKGLGKVLKAIHVNGLLKSDYDIAVATPEGVVVEGIRTVLMPAPLEEIRDPREKFVHLDEVTPASGVVVVAPGLEAAYAGSPFYAFPQDSDPEPWVKEIEKEVEAIKIESDREGLVVKADALGSLEALVDYARRKGIKIRVADVGMISKRDVISASVVREKDPVRGAILGFNVAVREDAEEEARKQGVPVFSGEILYRVVDDYLEWAREYVQREREEELESVYFPGKAEVLEFVFRRDSPAIFGVRVAGGSLRSSEPLVNSRGERIGAIKQIQKQGRDLDEATAGDEVAISVRGVVWGRDVEEGDTLYVDIPSSHGKKLLGELYEELTEEERRILEETKEIEREKESLWGY